jgi:hypothetical protein
VAERTIKISDAMMIWPRLEDLAEYHYQMTEQKQREMYNFSRITSASLAAHHRIAECKLRQLRAQGVHHAAI